MIRSDSLDALNAALSAAQGEFEAVSKTATNPFFKSHYAALPDVVKAATPILASHGLAVWQGADTDEQGELLWTVVLHKSGEYLGSAARLLPIKNDPQAQGSAVTYQRRYQYMAALGLVADEDDDGNSATKAGTRPKPGSRGRTRPQPTAPATPADGPSVAANGSQGAPDDPAPATPPITTEQLENIAATARRIKLTPAKWKVLAKDLGAEGKKSSDLTEDQATWALIKLAEMERAA